MNNLLTLPVVCSIHKKPCIVVWATGLKKVVKNCCDGKVINLSSVNGIDVKIINWVIHI